MTTTSLVPPPSADDQPADSNVSRMDAPQAGSFNPDPDKWYRLRANYMKDGVSVPGYLCPVYHDATISFWDYICMGGADQACALQFAELEGQMWYTALVRADGWHLAMKATKYLYRASWYRQGFLIDDKGHLYNDYWSGPMGADNNYGLMKETFFVGTAFPQELWLTNCALEEVA